MIDDIVVGMMNIGGGVKKLCKLSVWVLDVSDVSVMDCFMCDFLKIIVLIVMLEDKYEFLLVFFKVRGLVR